MLDLKKQRMNSGSIFASRYGQGWKYARAALSLLVVAATVGSLVLPAITLDQDCQRQEHQHSEACLATGPRLACTYESLDVHVHDEETCYDEEKNLICGMADFIVHSHGDLCYDASGALVCELPEVEEHQHSEECYEIPVMDPGHTHGDDCYAWSYGETILCTLEETQGHTHEDSCYVLTQGEAPACNQEVSDGHAHADGCYAQGGELLCPLTESAGHPQHTEGCYDAEGNQICQEALTEGHTHGDGCYAVAGALLCTVPESAGHAHADACYAQVRGDLICTLEEAQGHAHTEACHEQVKGDLICTETEREAASGEPELICEKPVVALHLHVEDCYADPEDLEENGLEAAAAEMEAAMAALAAETEGASDSEEDPDEKILICPLTVVDIHHHTENCMVTPEGPACGLEEHLHINDCFPDRIPEEEIQEEWEAALPAATGRWNGDLAAIAMTQLGYTESTTNRIADEAGEIRGYTRYGHLAGTPHAPWNSLFVSFCLHYAQVPQDAIPVHNDPAQWQEALTAAQLLNGDPAVQPQPGDLVFLDRDGDGQADAAAIMVQFVNESGEAVLYTIEGDCLDAVASVPYEAASLTAFVPVAQVRQQYMLAHPELKPFSLTCKGEDYTVTVQYGDAAALPEDVVLAVRELVPDSDEYNDHVAQIVASQMVTEISTIRLFDVTFLNAQGEKIEPAAQVDVRILYDQPVTPDPDEEYSVIHFNEEKGLEPIEAEPVVNEEGLQGMSFRQDSFSVTAVITSPAISTLESSVVRRVASNDQVQARSTSDLTMDEDRVESGRLITDYATMNDWKEYFSNDPTSIVTSNAGGVWTDKSVTEGNIYYSSSSGSGTIQSDPDKFLVGMSAIASTQSVSGLESAPTDVMFVLDISSSMYGGGPAEAYVSNGKTIPAAVRDPATVQAMVDALNTSIKHLNMLNKHNRVGVVLYWGYSRVDVQSDYQDSTVLMPLDRYSTTSGTFLSVKKTGNKLDGISISSGVTNSDGQAVSGSQGIKNGHDRAEYTAGTYAQAGILNAMQQFLDKNEPTLADGTPRRPVYVFMTDGRPTAASNNYTGAHKSGSATMGNNQEKTRNAAETDFLTQLTAAYAKAQVDLLYRHKDSLGPALFYSLGLGRTNTLSMDVLAPTEYETIGDNCDFDHTSNFNITAQIAEYWETLCNDGSLTFYTQNMKDGYWGANADHLKDVKQEIVSVKLRDNSTTFPSDPAQQDYVDNYYNAETAKNLNDAFNAIMLAISLQSEYTATLVQDSYVSSGYVTMVDTIGEHMTVTHMEGLIIGGKLYSGAELASNFRDDAESNVLGELGKGTEIGNAFVRDVATDFGMDYNDTAQFNKAAMVIDAAYNVHQLCYHSSTDFSNYIEWYGKTGSNGKAQYVGFAHEPGASCGYDCAAHDHITSDEEAIARGATHRIRSYFHYGPATASDTGSSTESNMMFALVWHRTNLVPDSSTGKPAGTESVVFALPVALLPTVDYEIGLGLDKQPAKMEVSGASSPAMLAYQVGLRDDVSTVGMLAEPCRTAQSLLDGPRQAVTRRVDEAQRAYLADETLATDIQWKLDAEGKPVMNQYNEPIALAIHIDALGNYDPALVWEYADAAANMVALDKSHEPVAQAIAVSALGSYDKAIQWKFTDSSKTHVALTEHGGPVVETFYFYSNDYNAGDPYDLVNAHAYFTPSLQNDRYYYTGPVNELEGGKTFIYGPDHQKITHKPDSSSSSSSDYFERFISYSCKKDAEGNVLSMEEIITWKPISRNALDNALADEEGYYYIPAGVPHDMTSSTAQSYALGKSVNRTGTLSYSDYPLVNAGSNYIIGAMLGNNGRLTVYPFTLSGTKTLDGITDLSDYTFAFELHRTGSDFKWNDSTVIQSIINTGTLGSEIVFDELWPGAVGTYYYVVREVDNTPGIVCDTTEYHITLTVATDRTVDLQIHKKGTTQPVEPDQLNFSNKFGVELPETGGAGVTPFILCGWILLAAAVMIDVSRRFALKSKRAA